MKRKDYLFGLIPVALITAGLTWLFGAFGLLAIGLVLMVAWFFTDWEV